MSRSPTMIKGVPITEVFPVGAGKLNKRLVQADAPMNESILPIYVQTLYFATADLYEFSAEAAQGYKFVRFDISAIRQQKGWRNGELRGDSTYPVSVSILNPQFTTGDTYADGNIYQFGFESSYPWYDEQEYCIPSYIIRAIFEATTPTHSLVYNQYDQQNRLCYDPANGQLIYDSIGT